ALAAGAAFATLTLVTRRPVAGLDPLRTTAFGCLVGGVALVPFAAGPGLAVPVQADVLAVVLYLGAVPTALAYFAYFSGLRSAHPTVAALSALLEPVTAALLAALVLGDRLGVAGWCGAVLLVAAIAVSHRASATAPAEERGSGSGGTRSGTGTAGGHGRSADVDPPSVAR
ncbi:DMT family transporter, partial [Saccharomonospora iraqiensis]|uniref:DMT family transporter n=1 Tax=Saccharomonospora iraqiensis TaxID=52698 RepID=UPI0012F9B599